MIATWIGIAFVGLALIGFASDRLANPEPAEWPDEEDERG